MLDIKFVRDNPDVVKENIKKKFQEEKIPLVDELLEKDEQYRKLLYESEQLRKERNSLSEQISSAKKEGKDAASFLQRAKEIPARIKEVEEEQLALKARVDELLRMLPNIMHESVPIGKDDSQNVVREVIGKPITFSFPVKSHVQLAEDLGLADFETSARVSGNGFFYLKGDLALLDMALINYARDFMIKKGYMYIEPPLMIREEVLRGVYSAEEIEQMSYKIEGEDLYLIATSEHPLIAAYMDKLIAKEKLPIKITGFSACFRKEIGSHGSDEKGLFRTHQFNKQEMIVICEPQDSYTFYDEMLSFTKELFISLELPIRERECCSGDLGNLKAKSADIEVWSPRKGDYIEVASCTNMESAQARRLNIRITDGKERWHAHTLNNTVIATSRAMVAILENFQEKEGSVRIPKVLQPYMAGKTHLGQ